MGQVGWHPWTELCAEEDGSFTEESDTGKAERSQQLYELMREQSVAGGESTGNMGGRAYESNPENPHNYHKTPQSTVNLVLKLRRSRHWGPNKIEGYLRNHRPEAIVPVSHRTSHRILVKAGLNNSISAPKRVWGKHRFEREHSNSLWQADFKLTEHNERICEAVR